MLNDFCCISLPSKDGRSVDLKTNISMTELVLFYVSINIKLVNDKEICSEIRNRRRKGIKDE